MHSLEESTGAFRHCNVSGYASTIKEGEMVDYISEFMSEPGEDLS